MVIIFFMVGDIKQSIYGFRLADPGLFLEKYKSYDQAENPNQLIRLKENFRSRGEVLNFTNDIFKHLMDEKLGEMTYGKEEALVQGIFLIIQWKRRKIFIQSFFCIKRIQARKK